MKIYKTSDQCLRSIVDSNCVKRTERGKTRGGEKRLNRWAGCLFVFTKATRLAIEIIELKTPTLDEATSRFTMTLMQLVRDDVSCMSYLRPTATTLWPRCIPRTPITNRAIKRCIIRIISHERSKNCIILGKMFRDKADIYSINEYETRNTWKGVKYAIWI